MVLVSCQTLTIVFSDCGVSAVGQGARLFGAQPSHVKLIPTEGLCVSSVQALRICVIEQQKRDNLLGLERAESVLYDPPYHLRWLMANKTLYISVIFYTYFITLHLQKLLPRGLQRGHSLRGALQ